TVRTNAVRSPKMRRRLAVVRRALDDAPGLRRPLLDLEPGSKHADFPVIDFDNCLKIRQLDDAVPCTAAHLEGDISLQAGKSQRHHGAWLRETRIGAGPI